MSSIDRMEGGASPVSATASSLIATASPRREPAESGLAGDAYARGPYPLAQFALIRVCTVRACPNRYNALPRGVLSSSETSHAALSSSDSAEPSQRIDVAPQLHPSRVRDYSRVSTELPKTAVLTGVGGLLAHVKIPGTAGIECLTMDG